MPKYRRKDQVSSSWALKNQTVRPKAGHLATLNVTRVIINLGTGESDLALHFNPRFQADGKALLGNKIELKMENVNLKVGEQLRVEGFIPAGADRFLIDLGTGECDLALHFNPRFQEDGKALVVCNDLTAYEWGEETRQHCPVICRGQDIKMVFKLMGDKFRVELPGGQEVEFPNRRRIKDISYICELKMENVNLKVGDQLRVEGFVPAGADKFLIDLGTGESDLAFHFNPRFQEDGKVLVVCNDRTADQWGEETRQHCPVICSGQDIKMVFKLMGDKFRVELPGGQEVEFPNRRGIKVISYICELKMKNVNLKVGDQLRVKGFVPAGADRFIIDLGTGESDLAFHFNPRFQEDGKALVVCNDLTAGHWGEETIQLCPVICRGQDIKMVFKLTGDRFLIDLGTGESDLALHFNPRFQRDGTAEVVCNDRTAYEWGKETRQHCPVICRVTFICVSQMVFKMMGDKFRVELPGGQEVEFLNRRRIKVISYICVGKDLKLSALEIL
ncbi:Galectin-2 [Merluccius polli]|uniref:Galectin n=1 Tax=Merluccius polli TaxID=89951 RepID=A0AA47MTB3_MERPO|nr:Galectin-2 [Merluccius polli]